MARNLEKYKPSIEERVLDVINASSESADYHITDSHGLSATSADCDEIRMFAMGFNNINDSSNIIHEQIEMAEDIDYIKIANAAKNKDIRLHIHITVN